MVESARAQALATHYARDVVTLSLAGLTTQVYFSLRSLDAQIAATRETLATREDYLVIVRRRADSGLASDLDLNQALGARSDAAAQLKDLVRQRALAEHLLGTLTASSISPCPQAIWHIFLCRRCRLPACHRHCSSGVRTFEPPRKTWRPPMPRSALPKAALLPRISLTGYFGGESKDLAALLSSSGGCRSRSGSGPSRSSDAPRCGDERNLRETGVCCEVADAQRHSVVANAAQAAADADLEIQRATPART